jgi:hypothetical protein
MESSLKKPTPEVIRQAMEAATAPIHSTNKNTYFLAGANPQKSQIGFYDYLVAAGYDPIGVDVEIRSYDKNEDIFQGESPELANGGTYTIAGSPDWVIFPEQPWPIGPFVPVVDHENNEYFVRGNYYRFVIPDATE